MLAGRRCQSRCLVFARVTATFGCKPTTTEYRQSQTTAIRESVAVEAPFVETVVDVCLQAMRCVKGEGFAAVDGNE